MWRSFINVFVLPLCQSCRGISRPRAVKNIQTGFKRKLTYLLGRKYNQCLLVNPKLYFNFYVQMLRFLHCLGITKSLFLFIYFYRFVVQITAGQSGCTHHNLRHTERPLVQSKQVFKNEHNTIGLTLGAMFTVLTFTALSISVCVSLQV